MYPAVLSLGTAVVSAVSTTVYAVTAALTAGMIAIAIAIGLALDHDHQKQKTAQK